MYYKYKKNKLAQYLLYLLLSISYKAHTKASNISTSPKITPESIIFYYKNRYSKQVYLKSCIDNWKMYFPLKKEFSKDGSWKGLWKIKLPTKDNITKLKKGKYKYKFIVDGEHTYDPLNRNKVIDYTGQYISTFNIHKEIKNNYINSNPIKKENKKYCFTFTYKSFHAREVFITGNFTQWNLNTLIYKGNGLWKIEMHIPPGKYYYKFLVDQKWINDPLNSNRISNVINKVFSYFEVQKIKQNIISKY